MAFHRVAFVQGFLSKIMRILMAEFMFWHLSSPVHVVMNLMKLCSNWLKSVKNPMGYSWDRFKSPFPWVSQGTDVSLQNPWDTHGSILSHYSW